MKTRHIAAPLGVFALALTLSGCVFFESPRDRAMRKDPNFQAGYSDGCASANARGTNYRGDKIRDDSLYKVSQPYRSGWGSGYALCNNQLGRSSMPNTQDMPDQRPNP
jgi:hypothetical protein